MDIHLRDTLEKLAWLELYAPLEGSTRRLAERLIRRGVKRTVIQDPNDPNNPTNMKEPAVKAAGPEHNKPDEAEVPAPNDFPQKIASFKAKYERS